MASQEPQSAMIANAGGSFFFGALTLKDMAGATCQRSFDYPGLTDHSQPAHFAGGPRPRKGPPRSKSIRGALSACEGGVPKERVLNNAPERRQCCVDAERTFISRTNTS
jgi:hypothetical protein